MTLSIAGRARRWRGGGHAQTASCVALLVVLLAACSSSDDDAGDARTPSGNGSARLSSPDVGSATTSSPAQVSPPSGVPATTLAVADTGVPGLDSDDAFCAAWSRFGGSWQVLVQAGARSAIRPQVARLEVIASTVVEDAYDDVFAAWPAELETERDVVADGYFGAFQRRSADAAAALVRRRRVRRRLGRAWRRRGPRRSSATTRRAGDRRRRARRARRRWSATAAAPSPSSGCRSRPIRAW